MGKINNQTTYNQNEALATPKNRTQRQRRLPYPSISEAYARY